jgi:N-dimethylarginine dimethylaminohydrolase
VTSLGVYSEYYRLTSVAVCSPVFYEVTDPINQRQAEEYRLPNPVSVATLLEEHAEAVRILRKYVREVIEVLPVPGLPYMFNIRDASFTVGDVFVYSRMGRAIRKPEPERLATALAETVTGVYLTEGTIEGGDVILDDTRVLVGISERTNGAGFESLRNRLGTSATGQFEAVPVPLASGVLHLDTALGLLEGVAIVCPEMLALSPARLRSLLGERAVVEVSTAEAKAFPTNLLSLDTRHAVMAAGNDRVADRLRGLGWDIEEIPMAEHHRIGGSIRCMSLPLSREGGIRTS